jgi:ribosomal protein S18 acetylase RimI-like enzyme
MKHKSLYIQEIYVKPSYRKKSIGRDLLEKIENEGRKLGADRMDLTVWAFNKNAIKFYEYCGMEEQRIILEKKI